MGTLEVCLYLSANIVTVDFGHHNVEKDQNRVILLLHFESLFAVVSANGLITFFLSVDFKDVHYILIVVRYK